MQHTQYNICTPHLRIHQKDNPSSLMASCFFDILGEGCSYLKGNNGTVGLRKRGCQGELEGGEQKKISLRLYCIREE